MIYKDPYNINNTINVMYCNIHISLYNYPEIINDMINVYSYYHQIEIDEVYGSGLFGVAYNNLIQQSNLVWPGYICK